VDSANNKTGDIVDSANNKTRSILDTREDGMCHCIQPEWRISEPRRIGIVATTRVQSSDSAAILVAHSCRPFFHAHFLLVQYQSHLDFRSKRT
jgi:hypothetical protein